MSPHQSKKKITYSWAKKAWSWAILSSSPSSPSSSSSFFFKLGSQSAALADLELTKIYMLLSPKCWDKKHVPPCLAYCLLLEGLHWPHTNFLQILYVIIRSTSKVTILNLCTFALLSVVNVEPECFRNTMDCHQLLWDDDHWPGETWFEVARDAPISSPSETKKKTLICTDS